MTRLFDSYLVVDWSSNGTPKTGKDSIWLALVGRDAHPVLENPATRTDAIARIEALIAGEQAAGRRVLAGFDFPFGYPAGFSRALGAHATWREVWAKIHSEVSDGADNTNDRFDAAARLNALFPGEGPFWGNGLKRDIDGLPRKLPPGFGDTLPVRLRHAETQARGAQEVWKLSGAGSVGGQALVGIAALEGLRARIGASVWPFEPWEGTANPVLAEVFPSLIDIPHVPGRVRDAIQVESLARALCAIDRDGRLGAMMDAARRQPADVLAHEATILGLGHEAVLSRALHRALAEMAADTPAPTDPIRPMRPYERNPKKIYAQSFATVRKEARLERFDPGMARLATRVIHACGMVEIADRIAHSPDAFAAGRAALMAGAPVFCDCEMVGAGIIRRYLPAANEVIVTLNDPTVPDRAQAIGNTRSAAAVELWADRLAGSVVAIGNAPTALFHLLELIDAGAPKPAVILGFPVGFVGAAESKAELTANPRGCDFVALRGRRGGSAIASAAVNALAAGLPEETT
jgi:precorrin-8X/cobalt-precorrin-8 methylmutase